MGVRDKYWVDPEGNWTKVPQASMSEFNSGQLFDEAINFQSGIAS